MSHQLAVLASLRRLYECSVTTSATLNASAQAYAASYARLHAEIVADARTKFGDQIAESARYWPRPPTPILRVPPVKPPCPRCGGGTHWRPCRCEPA